MKNKKKHVHVCMTPALIDQSDVSESIVVVIDILRATTSMCVAFDNEVELMIPVEHVDECEAYKAEGFLIAGERNGIKLEGFDFGNSPFSYTREAVEGKRIAITTTNGTRAIKAAQKRHAKAIVIGSFCNIGTLARWLIKQNENICLLCAGWRDNVTLEDTIFAGALARRLRNHFNRYQDTCLMAETLFNAANNRKRYFFQRSSHFKRLTHLKLQEEVKYSMRHDSHPVIPMMIGDALYDISEYQDDFADYVTDILVQQEASPIVSKIMS